MDDPVPTAPVLEGEVIRTRDAKGRMLPGFRPSPKSVRNRGTKDKLGHDFVRDLLKWHTKHGMKAIEKVGRERPAELLKIMASLVPKHDKLDVEHALSIKSLSLQELEQRTHDLLGRLPTGDDEDVCPE